jgi:hypothetical protein
LDTIKSEPWNWNVNFCGGDRQKYYLWYQGWTQSASRVLDLPEDTRYEVDVIDCWEMTLTPVPGTHSGKTTVELPARPMTAIRARSV